jgi:hypothetical protein
VRLVPVASLLVVALRQLPVGDLASVACDLDKDGLQGLQVHVGLGWLHVAGAEGKAILFAIATNV